MRWLQRSGRLLAIPVGIVVLIGLNGCQGSSIASRRGQRPEAYRALSSEWKSMVDGGEIAAGMDTNAVFIAWGRPSNSQTGVEGGKTWATWNYMRQAVREEGYWEWEYSSRYGGGGMERRRTFVPVTYLRASVVFEEGRVVRWQRNPPPTN